MLALNSFIAKAPLPESARTLDVAVLKKTLTSLSPQRYVVVQGPKGVGKSCVIASALQRTCGVVTSQVPPGETQKDIVRSVMVEIAGIRPRFLEPRPSALRVLWWYSLLLPPPIVVLRIGERSAGAPYAQAAGAVRELAGYGLRPIIDSLPNSLEPEALSTLRESVMTLPPMPRQLLFSIPEYATLTAVLREESLESAAWAVLGGVPALYTALQDNLKSVAPGDGRKVVGAFLLAQVQDAITRCLELRPHPSLLPILARFREVNEVPAVDLKDVVLPTPNKVLRKARSGAVHVPADAAIALVLRHSLMVLPGSLEELLKLLETPCGGRGSVSSG